MPLDTDAYLADTGHLSTVQHGAYILLIMAMWRSVDGWLPGDDAYLARATRLSLDKWRHMAVVIRPLLIAKSDRVSQKRILKEINHLAALPESRAGALAQNPSMASKSLKNNGVDSQNGESAELTLSLLEDSKKLEVKKERVVRAKARAVLPEAWRPSEKNIAYAAKCGFADPAQVGRMANKFSNHYWANGKTMANWDAAWRMWVDREVEYSNRGGSNAVRGTGRGLSAGDAANRAIEQHNSGQLSFTPRPTLLLEPSKTNVRVLPEK